MKTLVAAVLLLAAGSAAARNSCNLELDAGMRITDDSIEFYNEDQQTYKIVEDQYLVVRGQVLKLNQMQQEMVTRYAASIRATVPEVHGMALDGIDLAIDAITITFDRLLGEKNPVSAQLMAELSNMKSDVNRYFSEGNPITFNRGNEDTPDFLGEYFKTRVERIVETSVQNSIGSIIIAMGKEVLASGGNMEAFEARMNKFGEQMELQMNAKAVRMAAHGEKLCSSVLAVDVHEEQLKHAVPAVESFNIIRVKASEVDIAQHKI